MSEGTIFEIWNWHYVMYPLAFFGGGAFYQFLDQYVADLPDYPWWRWLAQLIAAVAGFGVLVLLVRAGKKRASQEASYAE